MKSCLKQNSPPASPQLDSPCAEDPRPDTLYDLRRKSVSFGTPGEEEVKEEVFYVEEYDRSPAQVTRKLLYRDILEMMELRLTLPRILPLKGRRRSGSLDSNE
ncbi:hypothetical protein AcW1_006933 [Taiwanofungus camphoratus]|nr:hypothetical protein AcV5_002741 [Antrodia cinnamomea]KAI0924982.1 hypothetical protein AcW2_005698 [Antrodia cinnamomea]KAI0955317.1 hypothetical protein AcW1_006933 [Antrodia cinnamomea]